MLAASLNASSHGRVALEKSCSQPFQSCLDTKCCHGEPARYGCYKRQGKAFAQCKRSEDTCVSDATWQCPGEWEDCTTGRFENCWDSMCCATTGFACMRTGTREFAQCRPMAECSTPGTEWLCPGTWTRPQRARAATPPPPPRQCSQPFQPCMDTHCCSGKAFKCIEKKNKFFAQCIRPDSCTKDATHPCTDITDTPFASPPPPPRAVTQASTQGPPRAYSQPFQAVATAPAATAPAANTAGSGDGGGGGAMMLVLIFLVAIGVGVGGVFVYMKYSMPKPPTTAPEPDDAMTPAVEKKGKKSSSEKADSDEEAVDKKKKKKSKPKRAAADEERGGLRDDVDGFD